MGTVAEVVDKDSSGFYLFIFVLSISMNLILRCQELQRDMSYAETNGSLLNGKKVKVVFVLGGPGSGKGTQCAKTVNRYGFTHVSADDLLRAEIKSDSENGYGHITLNCSEYFFVKNNITIKLLQRAMMESGNDKFLIDGFPRNEENRAAFEAVGREDDNVETIRKRFKVFLGSSLPVIQYYESKWKVTKIDAGKPVDEVFESVKTIFASYEMRCFNIPRGQNVLLCVGGDLSWFLQLSHWLLKKK
uniref:adenylate kinase n=1 Tax=Kalanchoe fedtschenkoi TaxID=63787 RepID=A0A7N0VBT3_KALFE